MNKLIRGFLSVLVGCLIVGIVALADSSATILETYTGDSDISVYIKGAEFDAGEVNVQIATSEAAKVKVQTVSDLDIPMKTLVMLDNSLSIPTNDRGRIAEFLQNLISDRLSNEEICVATFSEEIIVLTDYTSDYVTLKKAVDGITYQDQETYLTDVLYDLISAKYIQNDENVYRRIIVVSDGVDNKSLGYTKDELYSLLKDFQIPIYTIGCQNGKNNEELENMFALSRMTSVDYFLLSETEDMLDITNALNQDRRIMKLTILPTEEMMDGSKKAVKITLPDSAVLSTEILMPQQVVTKQPEETPVKEEIVEEVEEEEPEIQVEEPAGLSINTLLIIIACALGLVAAITVIVIVIVIKKKRSQKADFETIDEDELRKIAREREKEKEEKTEMLGSYKNRNDDGSTVIIWNDSCRYQIVLTDINSPVKSFQTPLESFIVVGRKKESCDIALDYEKSVSGKHCEIRVKDGRFFVKDLQSSNGTWLNGSKILTESEIFSGNILKLGRLEMRFEVR